MGEVYVAEDTKLSRQVALKVLPPEMAENAERRQRFEREAKAVAALNHPNIVTVFSVEEAKGTHFITMELVRGRTLSEFVPKEGIALNKFLEIAIPLADAVAAAHQKGITHRDLKPDNIMVSEEGRVKILDFGLAKLKHEILPPSSDSSNLPTEHMTQEGRILGTVAYMSPEQAEGKAVDHRSDIFSLGTVLYVMATGEQPFQGDTPASTLSSIIKDTPRSVVELKPSAPRDLGKIIKRCLAKDPIRRYQSAIDLRNELEELKQELDSGEVSAGETLAPSMTARPRFAAAKIAGGVLLLAIPAYLLFKFGADKDTVSTLPTGTLTQLTSAPGEEIFPSLSPDGDFVTYASRSQGNWDVFLLRAGGRNPMNLTKDSPAHDTQPAFSPDGELIAFRSERDGGGIFLMGATGESVKRLTDFGHNPAWSPDGEEIVLATEVAGDPSARWANSRLWAVSVTTGEKRVISEGDAVHPHWSPNGHRIAYWAVNEGGLRDIWTISAEGGEAVQVTNDEFVDWNPVWSPDGQHLYFSSVRGGSMNLWRVAIDEESGQLQGEPTPVTTGASASRGHLSFSKDGSQIAYVERLDRSNLHRVDFDSINGKVDGVPVPITRGSRISLLPAPSPDGEWVAFASWGKQEDIFLIRPDGSGLRQLTDDVNKDRQPRWSPDGKRIAFYSDRSGSYEIWTINRDGSELQQITDDPNAAVLYGVWSPDGLRMATFDYDANVTYIFDPNRPWKDQTPDKLPPMEGSYRFGVQDWSPDGKWLAGYLATEAGHLAGIGLFNLETQTYRRLIDFGEWPYWLADSRRLLFDRDGKIFLMDIESKRYHDLFPNSAVLGSQARSSKDDSTIYLTLSTAEADIWLLTLN
jgi:Tol biopolymer transport system component/predicted Ser/Thr protein kinase